MPFYAGTSKRVPTLAAAANSVNNGGLGSPNGLLNPTPPNGPLPPTASSGIAIEGSRLPARTKSAKQTRAYASPRGGRGKYSPNASEAAGSDVEKGYLGSISSGAQSSRGSYSSRGSAASTGLSQARSSRGNLSNSSTENSSPGRPAGPESPTAAELRRRSLAALRRLMSDDFPSPPPAAGKMQGRGDILDLAESLASSYTRLSEVAGLVV